MQCLSAFERIWKATTILHFSVLCVFHSKDSSVWYKNWKTQKNSWKFVRPPKIAEILWNPEKYCSWKICQPRKIEFGQISFNPKNRTSIPVKILTCAPWGKSFRSWKFSYILYYKMVWWAQVILQHGCHHISLKKFYKVWAAITFSD